MNVILASASPRRKEILSRIVPSFDIISSFCDEHADTALPPQKIAETLARQKAQAVFADHSDCAVLGADTIVYYGGNVLGKPKNEEDARRTLRMLSGKTHSVFTGYCIVWEGGCVSGACETKVTFHDLSEQFIREYVAGGSPMDKAGSYGIQDDARLVRHYEGSYTNIVGLPEEEIKKQFKRIGLIQ